MAFKAPYNFVPLGNAVAEVDDGDQISHDLPFSDGISGEISYTLLAHTPILIGGDRTKASPEAAGEVRFVTGADGKPMIPGSTVKGMVRAVHEIISFSRFQLVDDARHGLRDISGGGASNHYVQRLGAGNSNVRAGWIQRAEGGVIEFTACEFAFIEHQALVELSTPRSNDISPFDRRALAEIDKPVPQNFEPIPVADKYAIWAKRTAVALGNELPSVNFGALEADTLPNGRIARHRVIRAAFGQLTGTLVLTGQVSDPQLERSKTRDFVFYDKANQSAPISPETWLGFLEVHGGEHPQRKQGSWEGFWKARFEQGLPVPIFYVGAADTMRIGLAFLIKLAADYSVHDCIPSAHLTRAHAAAKAPSQDLAESTFGFIDAQKSGALASLRGRVIFGPAIYTGSAEPAAMAPTVLSSPKPTFVASYLVQPRVGSTSPGRLAVTGNTNNGAPIYAAYETYVNVGESTKPRVRGWKRYPARPSAQLQSLTDAQVKSKQTQVKLNVLNEGSAFEGAIRFHNLRPFELGALIWALTWRGSRELRHSVGAGKSFGMGQVSLQITASALRFNDGRPVATLEAERLTELLSTFEKWVVREVPDWRNAAQLRTLLSMASAQTPPSHPLQHMRLDPDQHVNEFVAAKQNGLVLPNWPLAAAPQAFNANPVTDELRALVTQLAQNTRPPTKLAEYVRGQALAKFISALSDHEKKVAYAATMLEWWEELGVLRTRLGTSAKNALDIYNRLIKGQ